MVCRFEVHEMMQSPHFDLWLHSLGSSRRGLTDHNLATGAHEKGNTANPARPVKHSFYTDSRPHWRQLAALHDEIRTRSPRSQILSLHTLQRTRARTSDLGEDKDEGHEIADWCNLDRSVNYSKSKSNTYAISFYRYWSSTVLRQKYCTC